MVLLYRTKVVSWGLKAVENQSSFSLWPWLRPAVCSLELDKRGGAAILDLALARHDG